MAAAYDAELSDGGYRLYTILDDMAAFSGVTWPKHSTLAKRLKISDREVRRRYSELRGRYIETKRGDQAHSSTTVTMCWQSDRTDWSGQSEVTGRIGPVREDRLVRSLTLLENLDLLPLEENGAEKVNCQTCLDLGYVWGRADEECTCEVGVSITAAKLARRKRRA